MMDQMTNGQVIEAVVLWLACLGFAIRDWRKWRALQQPDNKMRNKAIFSSVVAVAVAMAFLWVEFC
jgi:hypothetical protein